MPTPESLARRARNATPDTSTLPLKGALRGRQPGDRRVRIRRAHEPFFHYDGERSLIARPAASTSRTPLGRASARVRAVLFGRPLSSHEELSERLSVATGPVMAR